MDIFIDKFAQRRNAQEMIKANYMAEAEENERLTSKLNRYDDTLQEMRRLSLQNMENAENVKKLLEDSLCKIQEVQNTSSASETVVEELKKQQVLLESMLETIKELPTSVNEALQLQQATMEEMMLTQKRVMEDLEKASEDFIHKESVKVYRNVQAVIEEEMPKQTGEITEKVNGMISGIKLGKGILPVCILTLLATLANICVLIAHLWGYL